MRKNNRVKSQARRLRSHLADAVVRTLPIWVFRKMMEHKFINFGMETTNICNANCSFCAYRYMQRPKTIMPWQVFEKATTEFSKAGGGTINFTPTVGDPLVDKQLIEKIRYARQFENIRGAFLYTNGILLNRFNLDELLSSGLTRLAISTFIGSAEGYKKYYGKDKYDQVVKGIIDVTKRNLALANPVYITLHLRVDGDKAKWQATEDYKKIASLIGEQNIDYLTVYDHWGGLIQRDDLPAGTRLDISVSVEKKKRSPCFELYRRVHVLADGKVGACVCVDLESDIRIGDLNKNTLNEIWKDQPLKQYRRNWVKGDLPKPCKGCTRYQAVDTFIQENQKRIMVDFMHRAAPRLLKRLTG